MVEVLAIRRLLRCGRQWRVSDVIEEVVEQQKTYMMLNRMSFYPGLHLVSAIRDMMFFEILDDVRDQIKSNPTNHDNESDRA